MPLEREVKLPFDSPAAARVAVITAGATPLRDRRLQSDALLDYADGRLRSAGAALRIRREHDQCFLTFKGPVRPGHMKVREEIETAVGDATALTSILENLGLETWFRYEKYREELSVPGLIVAIDETPVGTYVELEGEEPAILAFATALGRTPAGFVLSSYRTLFEAHQATLGRIGGHMLFGTP